MPSRPLPRVRGRSSYRVSHFPHLVEQWHPTRNGDLLPGDVTFGSAKRIWWRCPHGPDHEWPTPACRRTGGAGCPFCANQRLSITNCLATRFPDLAAEWHRSGSGGAARWRATTSGARPCAVASTVRRVPSVRDGGRRAPTCSPRGSRPSRASGTPRSTLRSLPATSWRDPSARSGGRAPRDTSGKPPSRSGRVDERAVRPAAQRAAAERAFRRSFGACLVETEAPGSLMAVPRGAGPPQPGLGVS
jgi:hypothetical protein